MMDSNDGHPNLIRYYCKVRLIKIIAILNLFKESHGIYHYLALELCKCSLQEVTTCFYTVVIVVLLVCHEGKRQTFN